MNRGIRHALEEEFRNWQRLGQGVLEWDSPVVPEPYFHPFFGHGVLIDQKAQIDDGRRETLLSKFAGAIGGFFGSPVETAQPPSRDESDPEFLAPLKSGEAPHYLKDGREDLFHGSWLLPSDLDWNPKEWEPLLYALASAGFPVCLEILGGDETIQFRWVVDQRDKEVLIDATAAAGTGIEPQTDLLNDWLEEHEKGQLWSCEFALEKEFLFPIRNDFRSDPYQTLLSALARIGPEQLGVVQILFEPCVNSWAESLWRSVVFENGQPFFPGGQAYLQAVRQKCAHPLFAANLRLALLSDHEIGETEVGRLVRSLDCFESANQLVPQAPVADDKGDELYSLVTRSFQRSGMILNSAELFGVVHPPSRDAGSPALRRMATRTRKAPASRTQRGGLHLGINEHAGERAECFLSASERSRHMHVLGASGSGKSTFLLHSMIQDMAAGHGFALLDPHGDLAEALLDHLPEHRIKDVVWFNPADTEFPVGFNILRAHSEIEKNLLASDFVAIFERLSSSWGDQMTAVLGNAALALLESQRGGTLCDLKRFLIEKNFRDRFLEGVHDPEVVYFWKREFPLLRGTTQGSLLTRLSGFLRQSMIRNMVAQDGERFDVAKLMDEGKIILAPLSQGLIGQENSWLLGSLLVSRFYQAALSRQARGETERRPFYLYLDEAHHFVTPSIASILSGTRKYGLGLILAHQELDQFPSRESGILGSILTNCHTRVCFRLGDHDASKLENGFAHFEEGDLGSLGVGEAVCRVGGGDQDFNLKVPLPPERHSRHTEWSRQAVEHSRSAYASPREQVEKLTRPQESEPPPERDEPLRPGRPSTPARRVVIPKNNVPSKTSQAAENHPSAHSSDSIHIPKDNGAETTFQSESPDPQHPPPNPDCDPAGPSTPAVPPMKTPGRGGSRHKHLQRVIKAHGNGLGLRATIEAELPDKTGSVDVLLENGNERFAFEVADKSPLEQEIKNIRKCVEAGMTALYVVSEDVAHLAEIQAAAGDQLADLSTVHFVPSSDLGEVFSELGARLASTETTSRGFKVKVTYKPVERDRRELSSREIHRAVSRPSEP